MNVERPPMALATSRSRAETAASAAAAFSRLWFPTSGKPSRGKRWSFMVALQHKGFPVWPCAVRDGSRGSNRPEDEDVSCSVLCETQRDFVPRIQNRVVVGSLSAYEVSFGIDIRVKAAVSIQMVRSDIENDCDARPKLPGGFQLEGRDFKNRNIERLRYER